MHKADRGELVWAVGIGVGAPMVAALVTGHASAARSPGALALAVTPILLPLLGAALFAFAMRSWRRRTRGWRWLFWAFTLAELVFQLALEITCFASLSSDAQAAVALIFAPFYGHLAALLVGVLAGIAGAWIDHTRGRRSTRLASHPRA